MLHSVRSSHLPQTAAAMLLLGCLQVFVGSAHRSYAETFRFYREDVLGTSLELHLEMDWPILASDTTVPRIPTIEQQAERVEQAVVSEIDRLDAIFSRYRKDSELSRFVALPLHEQFTASGEFVALLGRCQQWQERTRGAFAPGVQLVSELWRTAEQAGTLPDSVRLHEAVQTLHQPHWRIVDERRLQRTSTLPIVLDAMAKGTIIDAAADVALQQAHVHGVMVNLGGDLVVRGSLETPVGIADPQNDADNAKPLTRILLRERALATSGNYRRGFQVGNAWYSHLIDPRTGHPVDHIRSSSVVASNAETADVLATAFSVMSLSESLRMADELADVECLLVDHDGHQHTSRGWGSFAQAERTLLVTAVDETTTTETSTTDSKGTADAQNAVDSTTKTPWPSGYELLVEFEINQPSARGYRRPFVAVWVEDKDGFPVRTLSLFLQSTNPGPRWHRDLRRWYRSDQMRLVVDETSLIDTVSVATRKPGKYKAVWDGKDDSGKAVGGDSYTLWLEAAREHGTYQLIKKELALTEANLQEGELKGNVEIKTASFAFRPSKRAE